MKRVFTAIITTFSVFSGLAQQDAQFSQNMFLNDAINSGAVGIKGMHCFNLVARDQWTSFEGNPFTGQFSYNGPLSSIDNVGVGAVVVFDKIGFEQNVSVKLNGAYHLPLGNGKLGLGLGLGILNKGFSGEVKASTMSDPIVSNINGQSSTGFDLGFGAFYYVPEKLYFGISGQKLIAQELTLGEANPKLRQHVYITGGYYYQASKNIVLKPNLLVKTDLSSTQMDVNLTAEFKQQFWIGASYRVQDAIVANVGFYIKPTLKVGLAYDYTTQSLKDGATFTSWNSDGSSEDKKNNRSVGAVEIYLGYCFITPPKPNFRQYVDPLFL
jgi:type IX secretion system PorP/SprF family membrane protein